MLGFRWKFQDQDGMIQIRNIMKLCYFRILYLKVMYINYLKIIQKDYQGIILMSSTFSVVHGQSICTTDKKSLKKGNRIEQESLYLQIIDNIYRNRRMRALIN